jgi:heat shock protein HtpX
MAAAYGLYTHIQANRRRSILLLAGLFFLVYLMVFAGALVAEAMSYDASLQWLLQRAWIDMVTGGREVTRQEEPRLYNLLENLCISRGIPMPKLKIMDTPALNAFASGMTQQQYAVTVTTGLLDALDDAEVEAVLGHELTHIRNGDVRMLVIAVIIAGVISFFAEMFFRMFFYSRWDRSRSSGDGDRGKGGAGFAIVIAIALIALAWFLSVVIRFALSRRREFLADAGSVELTKNPDAMISAMCVDNPREGIEDLFATHPPVDKRIDALVRFAGGHDPGPLAVPQYDGEPETQEMAGDTRQGTEALPDGPFGPSNAGGKPFLPSRPPIELGPPGAPGGNPSDPGPWGPHGGSTR